MPSGSQTSGEAHREGLPPGGGEGFYAALAPVMETLFPLSPVLAGRVDALLASAPRKTLLDLGSGGGLLAVHAAGVVNRVVAVDSDPDMLAEGARVAEREGVAVIWRLGDLAEVTGSLGERFGVVTCVGNTLLHLPDVERVGDGLRAIGRSLVPGGRLLVQTINVDRCLARGELQLPEKTADGPDGRVTLRRIYRAAGAAGLVFETEVEAAGERRSFRLEMPAIPAKSLRELVCCAGFRDVQLEGGYQGESWNRQAPATVLTASAAPC